MTLNYGQSCSFSHYKTNTKFMPQKAGSALQTATKIVQMLYTTR